ESKLGRTFDQGENSRTNSNRSIMSNSDTTLREHQNESLPTISALYISSNLSEQLILRDH
ncbi:MAG: hypothetical protein ACK53Y_16460, partial [bacterium]